MPVRIVDIAPSHKRVEESFNSIYPDSATEELVPVDVDDETYQIGRFTLTIAGIHQKVGRSASGDGYVPLSPGRVVTVILPEQKRSNFINFFIFEVISYEFLEPEPNARLKKGSVSSVHGMSQYRYLNL